ncbi:MAG TPA: VOC family protein [Baekduia sp.]|nr:VOC family protein [Baekduia sp.]
MLDHIYIGVSDLESSAAFYQGALEPLGMSEVFRRPGDVAFGVGGRPRFFIRAGGGREPVHVAFEAPDRPTVDRFHAAALAAGGRDNGAPGPREYHPSYYGAFVLDPDGHNVEAVCHR